MTGNVRQLAVAQHRATRRCYRRRTLSLKARVRCAGTRARRTPSAPDASIQANHHALSEGTPLGEEVFLRLPFEERRDGVDRLGR
jgi:hypothetical protein